MRLFHVPCNSFYVELVRLRYRGQGYAKWHIRYYSKASNVLFCEERSVKITNLIIQSWEPYNSDFCIN